VAALFDKFNQPGLKKKKTIRYNFIIDFILGGLNHIWNALDSHCNSHFDCGPDACCLSPTVHGKRALTDGRMFYLFEKKDIFVLFD
jgi:hypothetical protein